MRKHSTDLTDGGKPDSIFEARRQRALNAFQMPSPLKIVSRKSTITNAFVIAVIPAIAPGAEEIEEALAVLKMSPDDVRCAYCGDRSTEWDHLRPLVEDRRPTGFITEIANLVPACGKCNQSKGNKPWREWMVGKARHSPTTRAKVDVAERISSLEEFERWRAPIRLDFAAMVGGDDWERYWSLCEAVIEEMKKAQVVAEQLRSRIATILRSRGRKATKSPSI